METHDNETTLQEPRSRQRMENLKLGAKRNPETLVWQPVDGGWLGVHYQPIKDPVTNRIIKSKTEAAVQSLLYVWELHTGERVISLIREADILALLDGEPLKDVLSRRDRDVGNPFATVEANLPLWARGS